MIYFKHAKDREAYQRNGLPRWMLKLLRLLDEGEGKFVITATYKNSPTHRLGLAVDIIPYYTFIYQRILRRPNQTAHSGRNFRILSDVCNRLGLIKIWESGHFHIMPTRQTLINLS